MTYPYPPDVTARIFADTIGKLKRQPNTAAILRALGTVIQGLESEAASIYGYISDPEVCRGVFLDRWGSVVGEERGGLDDREYLAIILAKIAALVCGGLPDALAEVWRALSFQPQIWSMDRDEMIGLPAIRLRALVDQFPTQVYADRAGRVLSLAVDRGIEVSGVLYIEGSHYFDGDPETAPFDDGVISMTIGGNNAAA